MMQPIDVVMLTRNSEYLIDKCLASIYENVPVKNLIVCDGFSTDRTLKILNKINEEHGNVTVINVNGSRARAREKGIRQVRTEWFMFVDSDVILSRDWFRKAEKSITTDVGAVWGVNIDVIPNVKDKRFLKLQSLIARQCFNLRGGTHDTLIRVNLVKDIEIPKNLHVFEDAYIKEWITRKGYEMVACYDPYCVHYRPPNVWTLQGSLSIIADAIRFGSFRLIVKLILAYGFYTAYSAYQLLANRPGQGGF